jgi:hypothetical protein
MHDADKIECVVCASTVEPDDVLEGFKNVSDGIWHRVLASAITYDPSVIAKGFFKNRGLDEIYSPMKPLISDSLDSLLFTFRQKISPNGWFADGQKSFLTDDEE